MKLTCDCITFKIMIQLTCEFYTTFNNKLAKYENK